MQEQELKAIGARVRTIREEQELSQEEFGKVLDVNKKTISLLENGHRKPGQNVLSILSQKYKVNLDWVNSGAGDKYRTEEVNPKTQANLYAKIALMEMELVELRKLVETLILKIS